jgi:hypothetical protein
MKALLLVPFNTIYAQSCGDKLLRWKEKASNTAAANNSLVENAWRSTGLSRNAVVFYYEFCISALRAILLNENITIWKIKISRGNS